MTFFRFLILLFLVGIIYPAHAQVFQPLQGKPVLDVANILPPEEENKLNQTLFDVIKKSEHQVMVLIVPDLQGYSIDEFGVNAGRYYKIGSKAGDDGVLLTVAMAERKKRIDVGRGLEPILTDFYSSTILRSITPYFKDKQYYAGLNDAVLQIGSVITPLTPAQIELNKRKAARQKELNAIQAEKMGTFFSWLALVVIFLGSVGTIYGLHRAKVNREREKEQERQNRIDRERLRVERLEREEARQRRYNENMERYAKQVNANREASSETVSDLLGLGRGHVPSPDLSKQRPYSPPPPTPAPSPSRSGSSSSRSSSTTTSDWGNSGGGHYTPSPPPSPSPSSSSFDGGGGSFGGGGASDGW